VIGEPGEIFGVVRDHRSFRLPGVVDDRSIGRGFVQYVDDAVDVVTVAAKRGHVRRSDVDVREQAHRSGPFRGYVFFVSVAESTGASTEFFDALVVFGLQCLHLVRIVVVVRERSENGSRVEVVLGGDGERVFPSVDDPALDVENRDARPGDSGVARPDVVVSNDIDHVMYSLGNTLNPVAALTGGVQTRS
jgi:hypothetical protein